MPEPPVPPLAEIVIGDEPITVKGEQEAEPEHDAVDVANEYCFPLNVDQSDEVSNPSDDALAVGMLRVCVVPAEVIPNPPLIDVVAKVCAVPLSPLSEVIAAVKYPELFVNSEMFCPVRAVTARAFVKYLLTSPSASASVVVPESIAAQRAGV